MIVWIVFFDLEASILRMSGGNACEQRVDFKYSIGWDGNRYELSHFVSSVVLNNQ